MNTTLPGLHHITAITSDAQQNIDFYTGVLGLRLIKLTVNFDDPGAYHLYYGDDAGSPGTILTFFAWPGAARGTIGTGTVSAFTFAVPVGALDWWIARLQSHGVPMSGPFARFGEHVIAFADPDGIGVEIVATPRADDRLAAHHPDIPPAYALRGADGVTLALADTAPTTDLLTGILGFRRTGTDTDPVTQTERTRYTASDAATGAYADLITRPHLQTPAAAGTVHHVAWRTPDDPTQREWVGTLHAHGFGALPVMDRQYFHSIYFREPGGVLFEIATDAPGFTVDESRETLGTALRLPPQYEQYRAQITAALPPLRLPNR